MAAKIDIRLLNELQAACDSTHTHASLGWATPLDLGGGNATDHSYRLRVLIDHGLVEARQRRAHMSRGSKEYRITDKGRIALHVSRQEGSC